MLSVQYALVMVLLLVYMLTAHFLEVKQERGDQLWWHESSLVTLLAVGLGAVLKFGFNETVHFNSDLFFFLVLPPVIFAQGYTLKRKKFFRYFHYISVYGIIGTLINFFLLTTIAYWFSNSGLIQSSDCVTVGDHDKCDNSSLTYTECMLLAAVLSASDEVAAMAYVRPSQYPKLGALIFGEGIMNDALSIVLFQALLNDYNSQNMTTSLPANVLLQIVASTSIGIAVGLINARMFRINPHLSQSPVRQTTIVMVSGYLAYGIAEALNFSGILTLFFCAIVMAHYSWHSMSKPARIATKVSFQALSDAAEAFSFAYVGLSLWSFASDAYALDFAGLMLISLFLCRVFMIFFISLLCRLASRSFKLPIPEQFAFSLGGMVRGCISWAQILQVQNKNDIIVTTTLILVMATTLIFGVLLPVVIPRLGIKPAQSAASQQQHQQHGAENGTHNPENEATVALQASLLSGAVEGAAGPGPGAGAGIGAQPGGGTTMGASASINPSASFFMSASAAAAAADAVDPKRLEVSSVEFHRDEQDDPDYNDDDSAAMSRDGSRGPTSAAAAAAAAESTQTRFYRGVAKMWVKLDEQYLKPLFGGRTTSMRQEAVQRWQDVGGGAWDALIDEDDFDPPRRSTWHGEAPAPEGLEQLSNSQNPMVPGGVAGGGAGQGPLGSRRVEPLIAETSTRNSTANRPRPSIMDMAREMAQDVGTRASGGESIGTAATGTDGAAAAGTDDENTASAAV